jgi:NTP pyrophosphatase (non-canonical NTP hydrolase)
MMTIQEAQQNVDQWIQQYGGGYFSELTNLGILTEEVGEMAHWIVRKYGDQTLKPTEKETNMEEAIADEMTDVLWVLICLANQMGIDLSVELNKNIDKKTLRDSDRHIKRKDSI